MSKNTDNRGALDGIVIADFSRVLAGPYSTMLLADMGATVIKVESPAGDETRSWTPPKWQDEATYYLSINRNKHSLVLDFSDETDLKTAREIATKADIFIENFKPGGLAKFGLDYESIKKLNPEIIYASITGFGSGAGASLPGYDLLVQAASGLMSLTGTSDGSPLRAGVAVIDVITGLHTAIGVLAALNHKNLTGEGQHVETNLMSSALSALVNQASAALMTDTVPTRMGNEHPSIFPYGPFQTGNGELIIATGNTRQFQALCDVLGVPDVGQNADYATVALRNENRAALGPKIEAALASKSAAEWFQLLSKSGVPCAPINTVAEGINHGVKLGLEPIVETGEGKRRIKSIANPIKFSVTQASYHKSPPLLGQDKEWVKNWLDKKA